MSFQEDMAKLQRFMKLLEREYEQWFSGALPKPPWETKKIVDDIVKKYNRNMPRSLQEQYIFQMHQAKYNTYTEMWNRRMRLKEEGRLPTGREERAKRVVPEKPPAGANKEDAFRKVFDTYLEAKKKAGQGTTKINYDNFRKALEKQANQLRDQGGYRNVNFGVSIKNGRVSVVARPKK